MPRTVLIVWMLAALSIIAGCKSTPDTGKVEQRARNVPVQREAVTADDYVTNVVTARTPAAEADAIRKLRKWEVDNGMTYAVKAYRSSDYAELDDPSTVREPVRAEVTIYRGRDPVRSFVFQPKDNRNLALFGE